MSFTDFDFSGFGAANPFAGLPGLQGMQGFAIQPPQVNFVPVEFSTEAGVQAQVNPDNPTAQPPTTGGQGAGSGDTDVSAKAAKETKKPGMADVLKGLKAPAAPQPQTIRSPAAPQMAAQKSQLSALLASMGISPQQMLRLGQTFGR